jgi:putative hydrolase of the HAD superfamily
MIRSLIFDLGKTIIPFDFRRGYERLAPFCAYTPDQIPERLRGFDLVHRFESGQLGSRDFVQEMREILHFECDFEQFRDIWTCVFLPETLIPDSMLAALGERYRLVLLSNTNELHFEMVEETYPILRHFHEKVLSYKVGAMKPSPEIYHAAIAAAQCRPEECFFTDDIPAYIESARQHGIDAVQFQSCGQIQQELRNRGVEW